MKKLYYVNLSYACFGIEVKDNIIIETAPIAKWSIGKSLDYFSNWVKNKGGSICQVQEKQIQFIQQEKF